MAVAHVIATEPAARALEPPTHSLNPLQVRGTSLAPNVLLAAKLLTLVFLVKGLWQLTDPYLPYIGFLGDIASPHVFQHILQAIWLLAAACLFTNRYVRLSCAALGGAILVAVLSSDAFRTNNLTFSALLLILIGLSDRKMASAVIRAQLLVTGTTFRSFGFALRAACRAVLRWPASPPSVKYSVDARFGRICNLLRRVDFGHSFAWEPRKGSSLRIATEGRAFVGGDA